MHGYILCTPTLALDNGTKRLMGRRIGGRPHMDPWIRQYNVRGWLPSGQAYPSRIIQRQQAS